jgi:hypothetical protein
MFDDTLNESNVHRVAELIDQLLRDQLYTFMSVQQDCVNPRCDVRVDQLRHGRPGERAVQSWIASAAGITINDTYGVTTLMEGDEVIIEDGKIVIYKNTTSTPWKWVIAPISMRKIEDFVASNPEWITGSTRRRTNHE